MDRNNEKHKKFHLVNEMFDTVGIIRDFDMNAVPSVIKARPDSRIMLTGEGSSRIFPAKNAIHHRMLLGKGPELLTEGSLQILQYPLTNHLVLGASNSGKTKEVIQLFTELRAKAHHPLYGVTCNADTPLEKLCDGTVFINVCREQAVAATKSVVAQALVYESLLHSLVPYEFTLSSLADGFENILNRPVDARIVDSLAAAGTVYYAGFNNGVAEELSLKTCEILRKKSAYLPGTFLLHGIEEVISANDVIVLVDLMESEFRKIHEIYTKLIGCKVIAFTNSSPFLNISVPKGTVYEEGYFKLATGWNMMVEAGIALNVELDKPIRARKIGNEAIE